MVLEPIFEVDFQPCSYGFRPGRRAQDAIAEVHYLTMPLLRVGRRGRHRGVLRRLDHSALMDRVRQRIADKRVLALIKAFLKAGILTEHGGLEASITGTPQGGIITAPTQSRTLSLSARFRGRRGGVGREAWYSSV